MGILHLPAITGLGTGSAFAEANNILTAAGHYAAIIINPPKAGTISTISGYSGLNSGSVDVRVETVDASNGRPTGTLWAANTNASVTISATGFFTATLTAGAVVAETDKLAIVFTWVSGSPRIVSARFFGTTAFPYRVINTGSVAKGNSSEMVIAALGYNDGSFAYSPYVLQYNVGSTTFNSGSTPDEIGNLFTLPRDYSVVGVWGALGGSGADFDIVLYSGSTALATISMDKDVFSTSINFYFTQRCAAVSLTASTQYRLVFKPGASDIGIVRMVGPSSDARSAMPGGSAWQRTSRADAGAWTETATEAVLLGLLVDDSAASGGVTGIGVLTRGGLVR